MNPILLSPFDVTIAAVLIVLDGALSLVLRLHLHKQLAVDAFRLVLQLVAIGYILRVVFTIASPLATLAVVLAMVAIAGREVAVRPEQRLGHFGNYVVGATAVAMAATLSTPSAVSRMAWIRMGFPTACRASN